MALLCALVFGLLRVLVRSPRLGTVIAMLFVVLYGRVVGDDASVNRAVTAAVLYLGCGLAGLRPRPLHVLSLTALLVVAADPLTVIDVGAWLSFGATLALVLCAGRIARRLLPAAGAAPARSAPRSGVWRLAGPVLRVLATVAAASMAAELVLAPIAAAVFGRVGVAGLVLNFIAIPAMVLVQIGGMTTVALAGLWSPALSSQPPFHVTRPISSSIPRRWSMPPRGFPGACRRRPWPGRSRTTPASSSVWRSGRRAGESGARRSVRPVSRFWPCSLHPVWAGGRRHRRAGCDSRCSTSDKASRCSCSCPRATRCSSTRAARPGSFDVGGRVVTPAVWAWASAGSTGSAITHGDVDHIGGAAAAAADLDPREIWEGVPVPRTDRARSSGRAAPVAPSGGGFGGDISRSAA